MLLEINMVVYKKAFDNLKLDDIIFLSKAFLYISQTVENHPLTVPTLRRKLKNKS